MNTLSGAADTVTGSKSVFPGQVRPEIESFRQCKKEEAKQQSHSFKLSVERNEAGELSPCFKGKEEYERI